MRYRSLLSVALVVAGLIQAPAAEQKKKPEFDDSILQAMDHGPFYFGSVHGKTVSLKGVAIRLAEDAGMVFDTELMRMSDGWSGGYLEIRGERTTGGHPKLIGSNTFWTKVGPGWAHQGKFNDPRSAPKAAPKGPPTGSLPKEWAHFKGLFRHGQQTVLEYSVGGTDVRETPSLVTHDGLRIFTRTLEIGKTSDEHQILLCENENAVGYVGSPQAEVGDKQIGPANNNVVVLRIPRSDGPALDGTVVGVRNAPKDSRLEIQTKGRVVLHLPKLQRATTIQIAIVRAQPTELPKFAAFLKEGRLPNLAALSKPAAGIWGEAIAVTGKVGSGAGAYVVDTITVPEENRFKSWIRCSGVDFFANGDAAVSSLSGDVWIVSGLDAGLQNVRWKRFAAGLYQPLGLRIVDGKVYVICRDRLIRLHDENKDGEADFYESFNADFQITDHYHEFVLDLQIDREGNFYFAKGGNLGEATVDHHGTLMKVSRDGKKLEVVATGLRAPNGLGMGPRDELSVSDNEGNWVPTSRVNLVKKGGFYGHVFTSHTKEKPTSYDPPLFWLPHTYDVDNSSGGQMWVTSSKWGPFKGRMLHTSYGACLLHLVMHEEVDGVSQGAVIRFPLNFDSGIMRGEFHPKDGQLYVCGLNVWQSANRSGANKRGIFQRVRYTGKPALLPADFRVRKNGIELTFTDPLDPASAGDAQNYSVEQWNYKWTQNYGSPEFKVSKPDEKGHDQVEVKSAKLSNDRKTVFLELAEVQPVMQMKIRYNINAADGTPLKQEIHNTINKVPGK